jgi:3-oxoadipyl-CoA thiolase
MNIAYICDALRTPIGRVGGGLAQIRPDDMAAMVIAALVGRTEIDPGSIDDVILGCANQAGEDNRNVARMASLLAGLPANVPGVTVNRLCASGAEAIGQAARAIISQEADLLVAGGVESMSRAPYVMGKASKTQDRSQQLEDTTIGWRFVNRAMERSYGVDSMPQTAENVATEFSVSREEQDSFAWQSQQRCEAARLSGFHAKEIIPFNDTSGKQPTELSQDEHPRPTTTLDDLSKLRPVVKADGTITAGNASGINDGAAAMIIASAGAVAKNKLQPRGRMLGMAAAGVEPRMMGIGPVPATQRLLSRLDLSCNDFDIIEINEAFAAQVVASARVLGLNPEDARLNPHGGAIALGHPLGMSGARLVMTALNALERTGGKRALITMCVGVGQGVAMAIEREQG